MKLAFYSLRVLILSVLIGACGSGKTAYKHGDYYDAVLEAVKRLRESPTNKKSGEVLSESYQAAVDFLNQDAQNQVASNANFKWKAVVEDYNKINNLYENIRTSPGALKIIPTPVNKYNELPVAKDSAAAECYNGGVLAMLKNTRQDAKQAFFLFSDANTFSPGYRESIEMMAQAKANATIKVVVQPEVQNYYGWNFESIIFGLTSNQFVAFYSPQQAQAQNLAKVDQFLVVTVLGYQETRPSITSSFQNFTDSVTVGSRMVANRSVPVRQAIYGRATIYEKRISTSGSIQLEIKDGASNGDLVNNNIASQQTWLARWASCNGDSRAIPSSTAALCQQGDTNPPMGQLVNQTKHDLDVKLSAALTGFYANY
jgi:hypothetical protein